MSPNRRYTWAGTRGKTVLALQADEEQLLLEAIDMAGFGNWPAVADHVGTKTKEQCQVRTCKNLQ